VTSSGCGTQCLIQEAIPVSAVRPETVKPVISYNGTQTSSQELSGLDLVVVVYNDAQFPEPASSAMLVCAGARPGRADRDFRAFSRMGWNQWLASLPQDDWSQEIKDAIPVRWDPVKGWVEGR